MDLVLGLKTSLKTLRNVPRVTPDQNRECPRSFRRVQRECSFPPDTRRVTKRFRWNLPGWILEKKSVYRCEQTPDDRNDPIVGSDLMGTQLIRKWTPFWIL